MRFAGCPKREESYEAQRHRPSTAMENRLILGKNDPIANHQLKGSATWITNHKPRPCFYIDEQTDGLNSERCKPHHETLRTVNEKTEKDSVRLKQMIERIRKATYVRCV